MLSALHALQNEFTIFYLGLKLCILCLLSCVKLLHLCQLPLDLLQFQTLQTDEAAVTKVEVEMLSCKQFLNLHKPLLRAL